MKNYTGNLDTDKLWWKYVGSHKLAPHEELRVLNELLEKKVLPRQTLYRLYMDTKHWWYRKTRILKRDNNKCCQCGEPARLYVDHIKYGKRFGDEKDEDLQTLCYSCHSKKTKYFDLNKKANRTEKVVVKGNLFNLRGDR